MLKNVDGRKPSGTPGRAFISYVHDDAERVDRLQNFLQAAGITVWRDSADLWPGQDWKAEIRNAIRAGSLAFIACFSENSQKRERSFQNEELILAVEEMRLRRPGTTWLIPIRFADCEVPHFDLGAGRTLDSLHRLDLFGDSWERGAARLAATILGIVSTWQAPMGSVSLDEVTSEHWSSGHPAYRSTSLKPESAARDGIAKRLTLNRKNTRRFRQEPTDATPVSPEHAQRLRQIAARLKENLVTLQAIDYGSDGEIWEKAFGQHFPEIQQLLETLRDASNEAASTALYTRLYHEGGKAGMTKAPWMLSRRATWAAVADLIAARSMQRLLQSNFNFNWRMSEGVVYLGDPSNGLAIFAMDPPTVKVESFEREFETLWSEAEGWPEATRIRKSFDRRQFAGREAIPLLAIAANTDPITSRCFLCQG